MMSAAPGLTRGLARGTGRGGAVRRAWRCGLTLALGLAGAVSLAAPAPVSAPVSAPESPPVSSPVPAGAHPELITPPNLKRWISRMWEPVAAAGGFLSNEEREDVVVVLHRRDAIPNDLVLPVGSRGLGIFSLDADGTYRRAAVLEGLLPCVQCLGTVNRDPLAAPFEIDIADRQLTVSWIGNADGFVYVRLVFAWNPREQAFGLVADELVRADRRGGIQSRRTRDFRTGRAETDGQVTEFPPRFIPAERVQAQDYR